MGLLFPGVLLGVGLGGLADGIFLHQILQWHHLLCEETHCEPASVADLKYKTLWDGIFHAFCWAVSVTGLGILSTQGRDLRPARLWGSMLAGWGGFNLVEGIIDHHMLGIHHVRFGPGGPIWDAGFLVSGALLLGIGLFLTRATLSTPRVEHK